MFISGPEITPPGTPRRPSKVDNTLRGGMPGATAPRSLFASRSDRSTREHPSGEHRSHLASRLSLASRAYREPWRPNFHLPSRELSLTMHGDDFTTTGPEDSLKWVDEKIHKKFEVKAQICL